MCLQNCNQQYQNLGIEKASQHIPTTPERVSSYNSNLQNHWVTIDTQSDITRAVGKPVI